MAGGFLGMRGNGDWVADQRPMNWRQQILYLYPNGSSPLTAILSMMKSESVDDPQFHWWTQEQNAVGGDILAVCTDAGMTTPYGGGGVAGTVIYLSILATLAVRIRAGHQILLRDSEDWTVDVVGKVTSVTAGTPNSVVAVSLLEPDDNGAANGHDISDCDVFKIVGNINSEGAAMPEAIALNPVKVYNLTQIWRTPLSITRTARKTKLRTGDQYQKAKSEALEMHSWEMELSFIWGIRTENTGSNGKPERTTMGVINFIRQYAPLNCVDYTVDPAYAGYSWAAGGETWMNAMLERVFRYGSSERLCLCGSGALIGINQIANAKGYLEIKPSTKTYGMDIRSWITPFGIVHFKTHPLFSFDETTRNMMMLLEPKELTYKYIDDTQFYGEASSKTHPEGYGSGRYDGTFEEFLTEAGLEFGLAEKCGIFNGVGSPSNLVP